MADEVVVESGRRLSESVIWRLQRGFYDRSGVTAWNTGTVPHYITNNPVIARAAFRFVLEWLRDLDRAGALSDVVYVVEPGAGSGRFGFLFLKALYENAGVTPLDRVKLVYVMADFTRTNVDFWAAHPQLRPFVEDGHLDFAVLDVENDASATLEHSGAVLSGPLVVIGNYLFDTLTQDVFQVQQGRLLESLASVVSDRPEDLSNPDDGLMARLQVRYENREISADYYGDESWNRLLSTYRDSLGDTTFCLPVGALRCVGNLAAMAGGRLLMIISDKGWSRIDELTDLDDPYPVLHGESFSMTVNLHAIGSWVEEQGGCAWHTETRESMLDVGVFLLDPRLPDPVLTRAGFRDWLDAFGPIDFFNVKERLLEELPRPSLRLCLDMIRMSGWDPEIFYVLTDAMADQVEKASAPMRRELEAAVERCWASYYHIGADRDVPFEMARICYRLEHYADAVRYYDLSMELFGEHKMTLHNKALCYYYTRRLDEALALFRRALELDPGYGTARNWVLRVTAEQAGRERATGIPRVSQEG